MYSYHFQTNSMKKIFAFPILLLSLSSFAQRKTIAQRVDSVMKLMTLNEKVGQLNQNNSDWEDATGPVVNTGLDKIKDIREGRLGSILNVRSVDQTRQLQEVAMQSRMKIPLIFGQDVIHGFRTTFPIPLGESSTWDLGLMEKSARIAATEAAAYGVHWTFAPMVDIARDPRWGRVMEGAGEDTYLGSLIAVARVKGFQGKNLGDTDAVMACAKHFAAYGAGVGGRDYNSVDMSLRQLNETYLPPFKAASDAGVATFMNSFNDINGIPATASAYLQRDLLKGAWGFKGFVVSDWGGVDQMIPWGYAKDMSDAAQKAITAGSDMDMVSGAYVKNLAVLVKSGKVKMSIVDDAVRRILTKKFELGLFDDPFRFCNNARQNKQTNNPENRKFGRELGEKSIVLLKNDGQLLPVSKQTKTLALIGPFAKETVANHGFWAVPFKDDASRVITQYDGIKNQLAAGSTLLYAKGCNVNDADTSQFAEAIAAAQQADIVVLTLGEAHDMSGEAKSRSNIHFPGMQEQLIKAIGRTGKPIVLMINAGRPLIFDWAADNIPAIMYTWWLGTEAGNSIADVLFGNYNPAGKLTITFPRTEGQIPVYYNHYNTGRPAAKPTDRNYVSSYIDLDNDPKFPFGFGLSYTKFTYSNLMLDKKHFRAGQNIKASVTITNTGNFDGEEVAQLYIRDLVASVVRPVKELKGFQKIMLKKGESKTISFTLTANDLKFFNDQLQYIFEPGDFKLFIGGNSRDVMETDFILD
jgi:beta-glucosidase